MSFLAPISLKLAAVFLLSGLPAWNAASSNSVSNLVTLQGTITDGTGAAVPNASVIIETDTGAVLVSVSSDNAGHYSLALQPQIGRHYKERITAHGFRVAVVDDLVFSETQSKVEDVRLTIGNASETVTVTAEDRIGNGQVSTEAQLGFLGTLNQFDTPFSVASYTDQIVRDQQAQTAAEVLRNEPGLQDANGRYSEDSYLQFRGFALDPGSSLLDGIPYLVDYRSPSLENVERIELFKGPSALINGVGEDSAVGGTINLVTKQAQDRPLFRFDGGYSSNSDWEGHLDAGRRFVGDGILGVRGQLGGRDGGTPIDNQTDHIANLSLEGDIRTNKFRASVDASDQYRGLVAERGPFYIAPGIPVPQTPRLTNNIFDRSTTFTKHQYVLLTRGEYDPTGHIQVFGSYGHTFSPETYQGPYFPTITDAAGDVTAYDIPYFGREAADSGRIGTHINLATGPITHQITVSGDIVHEHGGYFFEFLNPLTTNIYNPVSLSPLTSHTVPLKNIQDTTSTQLNSLAAADVITAFNSRLVLIGGLRQQSINAASLGSNTRSAGNTNIFTPCTDQCSYDKSALSPSGAGLFRLTSRLSVYANYIQDLEQGPTAPTGAANTGQIFPPSIAQQQEAGAKLQLPHAGATLALFRITRPNALLNPTTNIYGLFGQQRNQGLEAEYFGNPVANLRLLGGFTLIDAQQQDTGDPATNNKRAQGVPSLQLTEGAELTVPRVKSLILTGRITASSGQYADAAETQRIPAWARLDISGRYTLPVRYEPTLRINIDNITGHNYWESGLQGLSYGSPRAIRISTGFRF